MASQEELRRTLRGAWWVNATALAFTAVVLGWLVLRPDPSKADIVVTYRLTAEVEFEGQHYTGSGVVETRYRYNPNHWIGEQPEWTPHVRGEAVAVDMGPRGALFVTLTGGDYARPPTLPREVFGWPGPDDRSGPDYLRRLADRTDVTTIPLKDEVMPKVVWFPDPADPNSAECLYLLRPPPPATGIVGPRPLVVRATLKMARGEAPTTGAAERLLPWMRAPREERVE